MGRKTDFFTQETQALTIVTKALTRNIEIFKKEKARKEAIEKKKAELKAKEEAEKREHEAKLKDQDST